MDTELTADLERRAARHAALSDPTRLAIVDLLALGDLSPTQLQVALGIPSNLLSHHLNVLDVQSMVARTRSEGDHRRSYVRLSPDVLSGVGIPASATAHRVVFVCTANSARSQLAAAIWSRSSAIPVASAGTHPADQIDPGAIRAAVRHHVSIPNLAPRRLDQVLADRDFIITVCDSAHEELGRADALHWSIPDPALVGTAQAFDLAFDEIAGRISELAPRLTAA
jgi:protein-tyrosine-phosphatase